MLTYKTHILSFRFLIFFFIICHNTMSTFLNANSILEDKNICGLPDTGRKPPMLISEWVKSKWRDDPGPCKLERLLKLWFEMTKRTPALYILSVSILATKNQNETDELRIPMTPTSFSNVGDPLRISLEREDTWLKATRCYCWWVVWIWSPGTVLVGDVGFYFQMQNC